MAFRKLIAASALAIVLAASGAAHAAIDTVKMKQGELKGVAAGPVASFKGVPFAAPPVGDLRWRAPQPAKPWGGVKEASAYGPACVQMLRGLAQGPQSEDCLTLNVWTPAATASAKLPVMVWIHGGGFTGGSGQGPFYDGGNLASKGVVVVTINYRLGRLGFFGHPAITATNPKGELGNYGLMDQIAALQWVKANIAAFGGDPKNVTAFGESAGGISINYLMTSPKAKGLFEKAIAESGFGRIDALPLSGGAGSAEAAGQTFATGAGVTGTDAAAAKALRALPAEQVNALLASLVDPSAPQPLIDGTYVVDTPDKLFAAGKQHKVPYLLGGNSFEASIFPDSKADPEANLVRAGALRDKAIELFGGPADLPRVSQNMTTAAMILEPDRFLARAHAKAGQPTWRYYFTYVAQPQRAAALGASHAAEISFVFNNAGRAGQGRGGPTQPNPEARALSEAISNYWVAFAKTSDPGSAGGPAWPKYDPAKDTVMEFGVGGPKVVNGVLTDRLDLIEKLVGAGS